MTKYVVPGSTKRGRNKRKGWVPRAAENFFFYNQRSRIQFDKNKTNKTKRRYECYGIV